MKNFIILLCLFLISSLSLDAQEKQTIAKIDSTVTTSKFIVEDGVRMWQYTSGGVTYKYPSVIGLHTVKPIDPSLITNKWLGYESLLFTTCGVTYKKPSGFKEVKLTSDAYSRRAGSKWRSQPFYLNHLLLVSNDNEFIAYGPDLHRYDSLRTIGLGTFNVYGDEILVMHLSQMRAVLREYFGKDVDWSNMLQIYPKEIAKKLFNTEEAIRVSFSLRPEDYFQPNDGTKKYKYADILVIHKDKRGMLLFNCLYTDEGKKDLNKYWKKIEKVLKFEKSFVMKD